MTTAQIKDAAHAAEFALAGRATITLVSARTQERFTYKISKPRDDDESPMRFVSLMNGPDNESSFQYLGFFRDGSYSHGTRKSRIAISAPSARAFEYFAHHVVGHRTMPAQLEVWHEGRCGRCGRKLTVPSSIESGIGPECAKRFGSTFIAEAA